jgi:hypothetical protein
MKTDADLTITIDTESTHKDGKQDTDTHFDLERNGNHARM